jgi:hypothetical protein
MSFEQEAHPSIAHPSIAHPSIAHPALTLPRARLSPLAIAATYAAVLVLAISPLFWVTIPALVDYPNHLARMWILAHDRDIPALAQNYVTDWRILPDLAMDLIVPPLAHLVGVEAAGRIFVALTMLGLVAGTATLHRALHGRVGLWPLCSVLFLYNAALYWGFLNCLFGTAIALLTFAGWIASRRWRLAPRLLVFIAATSLLFLLHLFAFCFYGLAVATYELGLKERARSRAPATLVALGAAGLQFLPGFIFWAISLTHSGPRFTVFGPLSAKAYAAIAPFTFGAAPVFLDTMTMLCCIGAWAVLRADNSLKLAPDMRFPLAAMLIAAALTPHWVSGSWSADIRLPVAMAFLVVGATRLEAPRPGIIASLALVALVLFGVRLWSVTENWRDYDAHVAAFRAADHVIPAGSRLLVVMDPLPQEAQRIPGLSPALARRWRANFDHLPALAIIDRSAFIPYLFSGWTTVAPAPRNTGLFVATGGPLTPQQFATGATIQQRDIYGEQAYWRDWPRHFDFLLWFDFGAATRLKSDVPLTVAARDADFALYRVAKP